MPARPWAEAWQHALYGPAGFYRGAGPAAHFRTSVTAGTVLAAALARLAARAGLRRVVDVGAGRGELLTRLHAVDPALDLLGVDVVPRPADLPAGVGWRVAPGGADVPGAFADALVVAHEWLDVVPCPVLDAGRVVLVDADGREELGGPADPRDLAWARDWWPGGGRVEVGRLRDAAWAGLVRASAGCLLLGVDYDHARAGRPAAGSLTGHRDGRPVEPVPDGSCDLTAHVAFDAVEAAGFAAGATGSLRTTQRAALRGLGVRGVPPPPSTAAADPAGYLAALQTAGEEGALLHPAGPGGFGWLLQTTLPGGPSGQAGPAFATLGGP